MSIAMYQQGFCVSYAVPGGPTRVFETVYVTSQLQYFSISINAMRTASSSGMIGMEPMSVDGAVSSFSFLEILDDGDRAVVAVVVGTGVSGIPHSSHIPEEVGETEYPVLICPIRDLDWRSPNDTAAALPISARQRIQIPSMCGVYFIITNSIQMPIYKLM